MDVDRALLPFKFHRWYGKCRKKYVEKYPKSSEANRIKVAFYDWNLIQGD